MRRAVAVAAGLRATLDQLLQPPCAVAGAAEGDADDAQYCCFETPAGEIADDAASKPVAAAPSCKAFAGHLPVRLRGDRGAAAGRHDLAGTDVAVLAKADPRVQLAVEVALSSERQRPLEHSNVAVYTRGLFTKHMKIIHQDAKLHAQRVAAIKRTKGTAAARNHASEKQKAFFRDPENRLKRSIAMKGVKFYCSKCRQEGHRSFYCPTVRESSARVQFRCRLCGGKGHNSRTCGNRKSENEHQRQPRHCSQCGEKGHNRRNCPGSREVEVGASGFITKKVNRHNSGVYSCSFCKEKGHNRRTCPKRNASLG